MLLTSHSERPKQRRVVEDADGGEVMIGENLTIGSTENMRGN